MDKYVFKFLYKNTDWIKINWFENLNYIYFRVYYVFIAYIYVVVIMNLYL